MTTGGKLMVAGACLIVLAVGLVAYAVSSLMNADPATNEYQVPGTFEATVDEPGRHYVWDSFQTNFDGKFVNRDEDLPDGYGVVVMDAAGEEVQFTPDRSIRMSVGSHAMKSVGYINAAETGPYSVQVTGPEEPFRVFAFAPSSFGAIVFSMVLPILAAVPSGLLGFILLVIGFVIWLRGPKQDPERNPYAEDTF